MADLKVTELATRNISLTDWMVKADENGLMTKNSVQNIADLIQTVGAVGFNGSLAIADTPVVGWYFASESGTYTNVNSISVDISSNLVILIVADPITNSSKIDIPLNIVLDSVPTLGSPNAVTSDGISIAISANATNIDALEVDVVQNTNDIATKLAKGTYTGDAQALKNDIDTKQDTLTFDAEPLSGSVNPVTSDGIFTALQNVSVVTDPVPTTGSTNAVESGGVFNAIKEVTDKLYQSGKNKYNPNLAIDNSLVNNIGGAFSEDTDGYFNTGLVPCLPLTLSAIYHTGTETLQLMHFYDAAGAWLGNQSTLSISITNIDEGKQFTTPTDCYFIATWLTKVRTFDEIRNSFMFELNAKTEYEPYLETLKDVLVNRYTDAEVDALVSASPIANPLTIVRDGIYVYIRSFFNANLDLVQKYNMYSNVNFKNNPVNFWGAYLVTKATDNTSTAYELGIKIAEQEDDACPAQYNSTYIGANHGLDDGVQVGANSHGLTSINIGDECTDGLGVKFYILRIVNANLFWVLSENTSVTDEWEFNKTLTGNLTHSSGVITVSAVSGRQIEPCLSNQIKQVLIDGATEVTSDGVYEAQFVDIVNDYDIVNPSFLLDDLITASGTTYTDDELHDKFLNSGASITNKICYRTQKNGAVQIIYGWRNHQLIDLEYMGFMQASPLTNVDYPNLKIYMPKVNTINDGVKDWNLPDIEDYNTNPNIGLVLNTATWEVPTSPPDRMVQYLCDASNNKKVGFAMGYDLTKGIGKDRANLVNRAWWLYSPTRKSYPSGIDSKLGNLAANTWYNCMAYRVFFDAESEDKGNATDLYTYDLGNETIVVFDYHTQIAFDTLKLDVEQVGKTIEVVEKSTNVTIHTGEVLQDGITVSITDVNYAYCVLKLS